MAVKEWFSRFLDTRPEKAEPEGYYARLYNRLLDFHRRRGLPSEQALQETVGGDFETFGKIERDCLLTVGWQPDHFLIDLGCGVGRLARQLADRVSGSGYYLGLDVSSPLLEEAEKQIQGKPFSHRFEFRIVDEPKFPVGDRQADFIVAFSVATHIDLEDTFSYLVEMKRVLKPTGKALISYLSTEIPDHWNIFLREAATPAEARHAQVRNHVMVPGTLNRLAGKAGLQVVEDIPADHPWIVLTEEIVMDGEHLMSGQKVHLGQSCLILRTA